MFGDSESAKALLEQIGIIRIRMKFNLFFISHTGQSFGREQRSVEESAKNMKLIDGVFDTNRSPRPHMSGLATLGMESFSQCFL